MAIIVPGAGSTIKSRVLENHLLETMILLQLQEQDETKNSTKKDYVQGSYNTNTKLFTGSYSLPVVQRLTLDGNLIIDVFDYVTGVDFSPGTGGTFKSTNLAAYFLEVLMLCQMWENIDTRNPQGKNNITGSLNSDSKLFAGSVSLPIQISIDPNGAQVVAALPYLS